MLRIFAFMHGHGHPRLAKKLNDKILKTVDEMLKRVMAFIKGETDADTTEVIKSPRWQKSAGFTPLTRTLKEILAMDIVNFPPPPLMVGTPEKRKMKNFCDYHQDRGKEARRARAQPKKKRRVRTIHVDGGSSSEVMYKHCFRNLSYRTRSRLKESRIPLVGFLGEVNYTLGVIDLKVTIGECGKTQIVVMEYTMVKSPSQYNALLDPTPMQTSSDVANPEVSLALVETRSQRPGKEPMQLDDMEERRKLDKGKKPPKSSVKEKIVVKDNSPEQLITIGGGLSTKCRHAQIHTLRKNVEIFKWTLADMMSIPQAIIEHSLDTYPYIKPKVQKKRSLAPDRRKVVTDEVNEWLKSGIVRRVRYSSWIANLVLVKKVDGSWRMCIDFKDLNKACPKDLYPFQRSIGKLNTLKKCTNKKDFRWTEATGASFLEIKKLVSELPTLITSKKGETLMMYLAAANEAVSVVLLTKGIVANTLRVEDILESSNAKENLTPGLRAWRLYTDGASNNKGSTAGLILIAPDDVEYSYALCLNFSNSNNDAKYKDLLAGLRIATEMLVKDIHALVDSKLVASQVEGSYEAKGETMIKYKENVLKLAGAFNRNYTIEDGVMYRKSYMVPFMRPRQVMAKAMNLGYYWPSIHRDARELIKSCDDCQAHASVPRFPKADMILVTSSWPFIKWGIDIAGPLSEGPRRVKYLIMATDYFTKWMKAKPLITITGEKAQDPVKLHFGLSPQGNGAVERENISLLRGIKTRLEKGGSAWAKEAPNVLWAHQTIKNTSNGETPFSLTYGTEAVILTDIGIPTHRTSSVNEKN
uniref:Reverse transcriptase domain-containing protein n=1 Tax=Tanacetum cinerariifolium TaxID=118510 RepID=A0A699GH80_TANCI|nr:reverse transcriptase domain-containing protein [Tanacetum cinerariifolium]